MRSNWVLMAVMVTALCILVEPVQGADLHPQLLCRSTQRVTGWNAHRTSGYLILRADIESNERLIRAELSGPYEAGPDTVTADPNYRPRNERYRGYNRFSAIEDAWHWFYPLLPRDLLRQPTSFDAFVRIMGEEGASVETPQVLMRCEVVYRH